MQDEKAHNNKFQDRMDLTYEQYVHACYDGIIQLSQELQRVLGREKAFEIIGKARVKFDLELVRKHLSGGPAFNNFEDFKTFMKKLHESPLAKHLFTITYPEDTDTEIEFHTTECLFAKVFRDMNAADLGYVMMCQPDFVTTPEYCPNVRLRRSKTLMQGDDYCDTVYCFSNQTSNARN